MNALTRRSFLASSTAAPLAASSRPTKNDISLAAWSLNKSFFQAQRWKNADLPRICRQELGINGIEFVNQFFANPTLRNLERLKRQGADHGATFVLIMIDGEGDMAAVDKAERHRAAVSHRKWVDVAHYLGCHAVRCNLRGARENWREDTDLVSRAAESFRNLLEYSEESELNILIENHGGASSDPDVLIATMEKVNHPRFGTLPDFGNVNPGADHYEVIRRLMPYAKGVSVKSRWTMDGKHPGYDLEKLIKICQDAGYTGFWGIESGFDPGPQGYQAMSADEIWEAELTAIRRTKEVLERTVLKSG